MDLDNIAELANDVFSNTKPEEAKVSSVLAENSKILPRKKTKGTILVLKPEDHSQFENSSQGTITNANENTFHRRALASSGADSAIVHEVNYSAPDSARQYSGAKPGQTAFQRLVLASKKIIKERSSSKKRPELRSHSQNQHAVDMSAGAGVGSASSKKQL